MDLIMTALYGITAGICALLPVSLDGILSAVSHFLGIGFGQNGITAAAAYTGVILTLILRYWRNVFASVKDSAVMLFRMAGSGFSYEKDSEPQQRDMVRFLVSLLLPAASLLIGRAVTSTARDSDITVEGICFLICGAFAVAALRCVKGDRSDGSMTAGHALLMGIASLLGMYPGISGFTAALSAALLLGYEPDYSLRSAAFTSAFAGLFSALAGAGPLDPASLPVDMINAAICAASAATAAFGTIWLISWLLKKDRTMIFAYLSIVLGLMTVILGTVETAFGMTLEELLSAMKG